jgi:hypothetical protein
MAQGIVAGQLMVGPGKLRVIDPGGLGQGLPDNTAELTALAAATPDWSAWTYMGLTQGGTQAALEKSYANLTVDQAPDWVVSVITERHPSVSTNLVANTLDNLSKANNGGVITTGVGTAGAWDRWEPTIDTLETPEKYLGLSIEGRRVDGKRMVVVMRRVLSVDNMSIPFTKDGFTQFSVNWAGHFVSDTTASMAVYTQR